MIIKGKMRIILALLVSSVLFFQNCATIIRGTSEKIPVTSNPIGAKIIVDGKEMGYTPLNLKLKRKKSHNIRIEKEGYDPFEIQVTRKSSLLLSVLGNCFLGGYIGGLLAIPLLGEEASSGESTEWAIGFSLGWASAIIVDYISGANYTLSHDNLVLSLSKIEGKPQPDFILIDAEKFQDIKWIRIKFADSGREDEIVNLE